MHFYYSDAFTLSLPEEHRFPAHKYQLLRHLLLKEKILTQEQLRVSPAATEQQVLLAHTQDYIESLKSGEIEPRAMRRIGFPWSAQIHERGLRTVGGAIAAMRTALQYGLSGQLAGGTHHAHADFGAGFCILNDFAVVARVALAEGLCDRIAIIDLDVHQGDGNAAILLEEGSCPEGQIMILDVFGAKNFPFRKVLATRNVALSDNPGDKAYLSAILEALPEIWAFSPDLVLYQAGVDALVDDRLGRMDLSFDGLRRRDQLVLEGCRQRGIPVSMAIGGGYANPIEPTVQAYANTYRVAKEIYGF